MDKFIIGVTMILAVYVPLVVACAMDLGWRKALLIWIGVPIVVAWLGVAGWLFGGAL